MNPVEFEILNLLSKREASDRPVPQAVQLALKPGAPPTPEVIATAFGTASEEVAARVWAYCAKDPEYAKMLASYERIAKQEDVEDVLWDGSILKDMTVAAFDVEPKIDEPDGLLDFTSGHTMTAQQAMTSEEAWEEFAKGIRPILAGYLHRNEINPSLVDEVLLVIKTRLAELGPDGRFRDFVPVWVAGYLKTLQPLGVSDRTLPPVDEIVFEESAVDAVLLKNTESESALEQAFCRAALQMKLKDGSQLLRFETQELQDETWLPAYRMYLFDCLNELKTNVASSFEVNAA